MPDLISRFSSRNQRLSHVFLKDRLKGAETYDRIAGYFRSSIFDLIHEEISTIGRVRIVCNADLDPRELHLLEALRTLRLIHYSYWLAQRWDDPAFPLAFPWFNTQRYWQDRILELREQVAAMEEEPLRM